jgi:hypothetical protein
MFISSYIYLKQYESDRTNKSNVYNEYFNTEHMDDMRRKDTISPQNIPSTICTANRPHVYDMRRKTSIRVRFAVRTFCGVKERITLSSSGIYTCRTVLPKRFLLNYLHQC